MTNMIWMKRIKKYMTKRNEKKIIENCDKGKNKTKKISKGLKRITKKNQKD